MALKRPEENYKYIFKKCLKKLKAKFNESRDIRGLKKEQIERQFYSHYFSDAARDLKVKLECFYLPRNGSGSDAKPKRGGAVEKDCIHKTISANYIKTISKSPNFMRDFHQYLGESLLEEYKKGIQRKIEGMFADWRDQVNGALSEDLVQEICLKIEKNNKFKMPWTLKEMRTAILAVQQLFTKNVSDSPE